MKYLLVYSFYRLKPFFIVFIFVSIYLIPFIEQNISFTEEVTRATDEVRNKMSVLQQELDIATKRMNDAINEAENCRNDVVEHVSFH